MNCQSYSTLTSVRCCKASSQCLLARNLSLVETLASRVSLYAQLASRGLAQPSVAPCNNDTCSPGGRDDSRVPHALPNAPADSHEVSAYLVVWRTDCGYSFPALSYHPATPRHTDLRYLCRPLAVSSAVTLHNNRSTGIPIRARRASCFATPCLLPERDLGVETRPNAMVCPSVVLLAPATQLDVNTQNLLAPPWLHCCHLLKMGRRRVRAWTGPPCTLLLTCTFRNEVRGLPPAWRRGALLPP